MAFGSPDHMNTDSRKTQPELLRHRAFEMIAQEWSCGGIRYCVAHGLDACAKNLGRDLDVLIASEQVQRAILLAKACLLREGWHVWQPPAIWGRRLLAMKDDDWASVIEVHTLNGVSWKNITFSTKPEPTERAGVFAVDPWVAFVKRVLLPLLSGDLKRFKDTPSELTLTDGETQATEMRLPSLCGAALHRELLSVLKQRDHSRLQLMLPRLRRTLMLRGVLRAPVSSLVGLLRLGYRRLRRPFAPCAPIVALVGPDGVGKSALLTCLRGNRGIFTRVVQRHWRPGLLPPLNVLMRMKSGSSGLTPDMAVPPRRTAGPFAIVRQFYYFLDFFLGYYLRDRVDSAHQRLVLYDRCALDMTVDSLRYGLSSSNVLRTLYRFLPKPDLIILLTDAPERIHARKPELETSEIACQLDAWMKLVEIDRVNAVLHVDADPEVLADRVRQLILRRWFKH